MFEIKSFFELLSFAYSVYGPLTYSCKEVVGKTILNVFNLIYYYAIMC